MFDNIMAMLPMSGNADGCCNPGDIEDLIDRQFVNLLNENRDEDYNAGVIQATYTAFVSMTISECAWEAIGAMVKAMEANII